MTHLLPALLRAITVPVLLTSLTLLFIFTWLADHSFSEARHNLVEEQRLRELNLAQRALLLQKNRVTHLFEQGNTLFAALYESRSLSDLIAHPGIRTTAQLRQEVSRLMAQAEVVSAITLTDHSGEVLFEARRTKDGVLFFPQSGSTGRQQSGSDLSDNMFWQEIRTERYYNMKVPKTRGFEPLTNGGLPGLRYRFYSLLFSPEQLSCYLYLDLNTELIFNSIAEVARPAVPITVSDPLGRVLYRSDATPNVPAAPLPELATHLPVLRSQSLQQDHGRMEENGRTLLFQNVTAHSGGIVTRLITLVAEVNKTELLTTLSPELHRLQREKRVLQWLVLLCSLLSAVTLTAFSMRRTLRNLLAVVADSATAFLLLDREFTVSGCTIRATEFTGLSRKELLRQPVKELGLELFANLSIEEIKQQVLAEGTWRGKGTLNSRDGRLTYTAICVTSLQVPGDPSVGFLISLADIGAELEVENRLLLRTEIDPLTRCWNRKTFSDELDRQLGLISRYQPDHLCCLALLDLDSFNKVNERCGRLTADMCLRDIGTLLQSTLRNIDLVARFYGDLFAILLPCIDPFSAAGLLGQVRRELRLMDGFKLTASIGLIQLTDRYDVEQSLAQVSVALQRAKAQGQNQIVLSGMEEK